MNIRRELKIHARFCAYCGKSFSDYLEKSIDHIVPKCKIGKQTVLNNLIVCCRDCNNKKDSKDLEDFITDEIRTNINIYIQRMCNVYIQKVNYSQELYRTWHKLL